MTIPHKSVIKKMKGPILIIGASGFVGYNIILKFLEVRSDVYGIVRNTKSWRLKDFDNRSKLIVCDITNSKKTEKILQKLKPKTIINCSVYGAYSHQDEMEKIYKVNFLSTINILEILSKQDFSAYIHCGSSSEYGFNCAAPTESGILLPNSHYAVSKAAVSNLISYYGKKIKKPVIHFRLYSIYGPWEEPNRLIPRIVECGLNKHLPKLVDSEISRDFVYIDDVIDAFVHVANSLSNKHWGEAYNIGTGVKTTIKNLAELAIVIYDIQSPIKFGSMKNRSWDLRDWYANTEKMQADFNWKYKTNLKQGLDLTSNWQENKSK